MFGEAADAHPWSVVGDSTEGAGGLCEGQGKSSHSSTGIAHRSIGHTRRSDAKDFGFLSDDAFFAYATRYCPVGGGVLAGITEEAGAFVMRPSRGGGRVGGCVWLVLCVLMMSSCSLGGDTPAICFWPF